ncbi:hypothetical protein [Amycolatopsis sp. DSM 110486]|uniref:nucleotide-binding domain-containing protein n=1 Tax=Amycolatopsis sp. DSM 110486 TaxID=2865832 RepID=UPI00351CF176
MGKPVPKTTTAKATSETCPYVNTEEFIEDKYPVDGRYAVSIDCRVAQNGFRTVRPRKMLRNRGFEAQRRDQIRGQIVAPNRGRGRHEKSLRTSCRRDSCRLGTPPPSHGPGKRRRPRPPS